MALHAFGPAVDVLAGGGDLRFPHHAYQAALAGAFTGVTPFARARLNAGVVGVGGAKMAKSAGNLVLVSELLEDYPAGAIRLLILDRRWDQDWDYDRAGLDRAAERLDRLQSAAGRPGRATPGTGGAAAAAAAPRWPATSTCPPRWSSPRRTAGRPPGSSAPSWGLWSGVASAQRRPARRRTTIHPGRGWPDNTRAGIPLSSDQVSGVVLTTWQEN
jgi:hypothetical protein